MSKPTSKPACHISYAGETFACGIAELPEGGYVALLGTVACKRTKTYAAAARWLAARGRGTKLAA